MQNDNQLNNKDPLIKQLEATNAKLTEINLNMLKVFIFERLLGWYFLAGQLGCH